MFNGWYAGPRVPFRSFDDGVSTHLLLLLLRSSESRPVHMIA